MKKMLVCASYLLIGSALIADQEPQIKNTKESDAFFSKVYDKGTTLLQYLKEKASSLSQKGLDQGWPMIKAGAYDAWNQSALCMSDFVDATSTDASSNQTDSSMCTKAGDQVHSLINFLNTKITTTPLIMIISFIIVHKALNKFYNHGRSINIPMDNIQVNLQ